MSKYDKYGLQDLWTMLAFLEQNNAVNSELQNKLKYHVEKGILTDSEVAPFVQKTTEAFIAVDLETIEVEKALDKKVRNITGIRHLSTSLLRFSRELEDLINARQKENFSENKSPLKKINYD